jgi:hypothetical protein
MPARQRVQLNVDEISAAPPPMAERIRAKARFLAATGPLALAPEAAPLKETKPGKERWAIKTGIDKQAPQVGKAKGGKGKGKFHFVDTTVEEMVELPRPPDMRPPSKSFKKFEQTRANPVELTIWRLEADVIALKLEDDGDMHIVLRGESGTLMIAETPTARDPFVGANSPWLGAMDKVRRALNERFGNKVVPMAISAEAEKLMPPGAFVNAGAMAEAQPLPLADLIAEGKPFAVKIDPIQVRVTGVGFFDRVHGQNGVAKNGIELHPLLDIKFI